MLAFSSDVDLARYEPSVFGSWYLSSQVLCSGTNGIVAGTQFTAAGVDFDVSQVSAGMVIWLESSDGAIKGAFEIVEVIDSGHLRVSVPRVSDMHAAIPVGSASGLAWRIVSYGLQAYEVLWELSHKLGLQPGCPEAESSVDDIVNADAMRQASVFGILELVFEALYMGLEGQEVLKEKKDHYKWRCNEAEHLLKVRVDSEQGQREIQPGVGKMVRE